ncbi:hypothetical protein DVDV_3352 [Desulfovibrio sp. DV]|nr:hypothetical protein DVDV_3352 [Desulfovibrio sp. DV]
MHVRGLAKGRGPVKTGYGRARAFGVKKATAFSRKSTGDTPAGATGQGVRPMRRAMKKRSHPGARCRPSRPGLHHHRPDRPAPVA